MQELRWLAAEKLLNALGFLCLAIALPSGLAVKGLGNLADAAQVRRVRAGAHARTQQERRRVVR